MSVDVEFKPRLNIGVRVFKRTDTNLIIFWNLQDLSEEQKNAVQFARKTGTDFFTPLKYEKMADPKQSGFKKNVGLAIINHVENKLDPDGYYLFKATFGIEQPSEVFFEVFPLGVLPDQEKDSKKQHMQLMGWVAPKKRWHKVPLVKCKDGSYAIAVKIID